MAHKNLKKKRRIFGEKDNIVTIVFSFIAFASVIFVFVVFYLISDMPDINNLEAKGRRASIIFKAHDGSIIATYGDLFRNVVNAATLPQYIGQAFVAIEDKRFYQHSGIDFFGLFRAIYNNFVEKSFAQGGSTITQQIAKNLFLSSEKSLKRKVQEIVLALWLERKFSKQQLLSIYLNRVYFGGGAFGLDAAAYRYFNKNAKELSLYEAAKLAGILKSPVAYSPFYNKKRSDERAELVLACMVEEHCISKEEMNEAICEKENSSLVPSNLDENRYFTDWLLEKLQNLVSTDCDDLVVYTTLDTKLQKNATYIIRNQLLENGFKNSITQMAIVAIDTTGAVRAMVGGHTYKNSQFNRVMAIRSPGSLFKLFVYLSALENGIDIQDNISDLPITIGNWSPKNCGYLISGSISLIDAFAYSVNTATVRLAQNIGLDYICNRAKDLGITNDINKNYTSILGTSGTTLIEMTSAYGVIMADGSKLIPYGIINIKSKKGKVLYQAVREKANIVVKKVICDKMKTLLKSVIDYGTAKKAKLPVDSYGKTGTSSDNRDASFIGFVAPIVVGVWCGNDDNTPMKTNVTGGTIPALVWKEFMLYAFGYKNMNIKELSIDSKEKETILKHNETKKQKSKMRVTDFIKTLN